MMHELFHRLVFCLLVFMATHAVYGQASVTALGPFGGDVRSLGVHPKSPDTFFLGTSDGQIFVSRDAGQNWTKLDPGIGRRNLVIDNLAFDPNLPDTLYAAAWELQNDRGWLYRTRDGGTSWEEIPLGRYSSSIRAIAVAPTDPQRIALGITEGVVLSLDGGASWDRITRGYRSLHKAESLAFDPQDPDTLYVGTWHLGWKTPDGGKSWKAIHSGMIDDSDMFSLLVNPVDPDILYSSACTGVYKSANGGLKWTKLNNGLPKEARRTRTLHMDPSNPDTVYAGTTVGLFASQNAGRSWKELLPGVVVNTVAVHPLKSQLILVGTDDAGILKSDDGGKTFQASNHGFIHRQVITVVATPDSGYFASVSADASHGGLFSSSDGGRNWSPHNQGLGEAVPEIRSILRSRQNGRLYLGTPRGVFVGLASEESWKLVESSKALEVLDLAFSDGETGLYLATPQGVFHLSLKDGTLRDLALPEATGQSRAIFYHQDSRRLFVGAGEGLYYSLDGGKSWKPTRGLNGHRINVLSQNGRFLFAGTDGGLFFSDDQGDRWSPSPGVFPVDIVDVEVNGTDPREMVAADWVTGTVFFTRNGGEQWEILPLAGNPSKISSLEYDHSGRLLAGTVSDGVYLISGEAESSSSGR